MKKILKIRQKTKNIKTQNNINKHKKRPRNDDLHARNFVRKPPNLLKKHEKFIKKRTIRTKTNKKEAENDNKNALETQKTRKKC